jgi:hypothetical protein
VSASVSNGDKRAFTSPGNGGRSNGARTAEGLLANALAKTTHGIRAWTPVLPTECEEDWIELRDGINKDWHPVGRTEEELTYSLSMAFWQRRRLYRHEKELVLHNAKEEAFPYPWSHHDDDEEQALSDPSIWNGGQAALRKEIAVCETVLSMLGLLGNEPDTTPFASDDALLLVDRILRSVLKKGDPLPCLSEPAEGWTVGAIRELVAELASDCRKKPEGLLSVVYRTTRERLESMQGRLDQILHHVEKAAVPAGFQNHDAARLWDYDRRHLNTTIRCIHELQRLQAIRRGQVIAPPAALDVTVTHQIDANP